MTEEDSQKVQNFLQSSSDDDNSSDKSEAEEQNSEEEAVGEWGMANAKEWRENMSPVRKNASTINRFNSACMDSKRKYLTEMTRRKKKFFFAAKETKKKKYRTDVADSY
eukprot:TRINITY_DN4473_c0_g1_i1.p1 TRINITY_DN4473_c0_g1~~TRINITY_DN4473_c0_g1_i1.p1  ORF type:complete len:109 (-),score=38.01 TRINITY_DN4473_c0_g1_i1:29-355(-)